MRVNTGTSRPPLLALTLHQPWAYGFTHLGKLVENREWASGSLYRGRWMAVHAGSTFDEAGYHALLDEGFTMPLPEAIVRGAIVAVACFDRIVTGEGMVPPDQRRWFCGPVGWLFTRTVVLPRPVRCAGRKGLWEPESWIVDRVRDGFMAARIAR